MAAICLLLIALFMVLRRRISRANCTRY